MGEPTENEIRDWKESQRLKGRKIMPEGQRQTSAPMHYYNDGSKVCTLVNSKPITIAIASDAGWARIMVHALNSRNARPQHNQMIARFGAVRPAFG